MSGTVTVGEGELMEAVWSSLESLGFDEQEQRGVYGIDFEKTMFQKANHQKGAYVIIYFLLCAVDPKTSQEFLGVWPIMEVKDNAKFRQVAAKKIAKVGVDKEDTVASILNNTSTTYAPFMLLCSFH